MQNVRIFYEKTGRAKYISHLDINRCFQRAIRRANLPIWYTEGFSPHPYITFALPLPLGFESVCECLDMRLVEEWPYEKIKEALNAVLPEGLHVTQAAQPQNKPQAIVRALYQITLTGDSAAILHALDSLLCQERILVMKKTKKGLQEMDIKPHIVECTYQECGQGVQMMLKLPAGVNENINPSLLLNLLKEQYHLQQMHISVLKLAVLDEKGQKFS